MSIAAKTKHYIVSRPTVKDCLRRGIINYSALAEEICEEFCVESRAAVVAAARRYAAQLKRQGSSDKAVDRALRNAQLSFRSNMSLLVLERPLTERMISRLHEEIRSLSDGFNLVEGEKRAIVIANDALAPKVRRITRGKAREEFSTLVQITITQSVKVMTTKGVASRLYSLFAQEGISPVESLLVGGEHLLFVQEPDLLKVMELIREGYIGVRK